MALGVGVTQMFTNVKLARTPARVKPLVERLETTLRFQRRTRCVGWCDLICRTAGYVTRMSGGVGGRGREVPSYPDVRPAWARSWRCKSSRKLTTASEVKRNCVRVTERGEEA